MPDAQAEAGEAARGRPPDDSNPIPEPRPSPDAGGPFEAYCAVPRPPEKSGNTPLLAGDRRVKPSQTTEMYTLDASTAPFAALPSTVEPAEETDVDIKDDDGTGPPCTIVDIGSAAKPTQTSEMSGDNPQSAFHATVG